MTEKQIEALLEPETRSITFPDGTTRPFYGYKSLWDAHDWLLRFGYTPEDIIQMTLRECEEMNRAFDICYPHVIGYMVKVFSKALADGTTPRKPGT